MNNHNHNTHSQSTTIQTSILWLEIHQSQITQLQRFKCSSQSRPRLWGTLALLDQSQNYREIPDNGPHYAHIWALKKLMPFSFRVRGFPLSSGSVPQTPVLGSRKAHVTPALSPKRNFWIRLWTCGFWLIALRVLLMIGLYTVLSC